MLICEDQELVRTGYTTIFAAQPDMEVVGEAADGRAAVEAARRLQPGRRRDGHPDAACSTASRRPGCWPAPASRTPAKVLVVTTFNVDEYVYEALRAGASGFLLKDAPPAELLQRRPDRRPRRVPAAPPP